MPATGYTKLTEFSSVGLSSHVTCSSANDNLIIDVSGVYEVGFDMSYYQNQVGYSKLSVMKNGLATNIWKVITGTTSYVTNINSTGKIRLTAGDVITLSYHNLNGVAANNVPTHGRLYVNYIGK